jgi:hypothetical protein
LILLGSKLTEGKMTTLKTGTIVWGGSHSVEVSYKIERTENRKNNTVGAIGTAHNETYNALYNAQLSADTQLIMADGRAVEIVILKISEGTTAHFSINTRIDNL